MPTEPASQVKFPSRAPALAALTAAVLACVVVAWMPLDGTDRGGSLHDRESTGLGNARGEPFNVIRTFRGLDPQVVSLGRSLFHDPRLSRDKTVSCATCHDLTSGGDDGLPVSIGIDQQLGDRNAPTVYNASLNAAQFWDGRAPTLVEQVDGPIHNPKEMDTDWAVVLRRLADDTDCLAAFRAAYGGPPTPDRVRHAIATFEMSLATPGADFDRWLTGDDQALSDNELEGLKLFKKHGCVTCHQGRALGGNLFQPLGLMQAYFDDDDDGDLGRFNHTQREEDKHVFRVPSLRNVALTAPYFHDGSAGTLHAAVRIMLRHQVGVEPDEQEVSKLVDFLHTLTGQMPR